MYFIAFLLVVYAYAHWLKWGTAKDIKRLDQEILELEAEIFQLEKQFPELKNTRQK